MKKEYTIAALITAWLGSLAFGQETIPEWDIPRLRAEAPRNGWTYEVRQSWVTEHLKKNRGSYRQITGLSKPFNWQATAVFDDLSDKLEKWKNLPLPTKFDWREEAMNGLQPMRNQKNCGSCWAFSVLSVLESLIKIKVPEYNPDLAEQTLVSSCESGGSCAGGYFSAMNYLQNPGVPDEAQDPYRASNSSCKPGLKAVAKIKRWAYLKGPNGGAPTVEQVKIALIEYGPLSVEIAAGGLGSYGSGVYNACSSSRTDHMVNISGYYEDPTHGTVYIVRNSWGDWGMAGWADIVAMKNGRRCNQIANVVAYAVLDENYVGQLKAQVASRNFLSQ